MSSGDALGNLVFTFDRNQCSRSPEYALIFNIRPIKNFDTHKSIKVV